MDSWQSPGCNAVEAAGEAREDIASVKGVTKPGKVATSEAAEKPVFKEAAEEEAATTASADVATAAAASTAAEPL